MEFTKQWTVTDNLGKYDYLSDDNDYISVSEWSNGDGYDIDINGRQQLHLTVGEIEAINYLIKSIDYNKDKFPKTED